MATNRFLIHLGARERRPVDPAEIYYLEAEGETTSIRLRAKSPLIDGRPLGEIEPLLVPFGFLRIHRNHMVNLDRVQSIRGREDGVDWEAKMDPPVSRVLPIGRGRLDEVWEAFGE